MDNEKIKTTVDSIWHVIECESKTEDIRCGQNFRLFYEVCEILFTKSQNDKIDSDRGIVFWTTEKKWKAATEYMLDNPWNKKS